LTGSGHDRLKQWVKIQLSIIIPFSTRRNGARRFHASIIMSNLRYRPEIDGLRAVAVLGVVLYHIGLGFPGGYVGVDVFFVISGYLITGIIAEDLRNGTFSMCDFWVRRIRRILPAVTVMVLVSLGLGYWILEPQQFVALSKSAMAQSLMGANVFFWMDSGYFAEVSEMKPLLHTWSLAVEEQFYVIFPLLLFFLSKRLRKYTLPILLVMGVGSLLLSCWALIYKPGANFFLLPTRAWELLAGSCLALMVQQKEWSRGVSEIVAWLGLGLIAVSMFFYTAKTPFPGWNAMAPVAGSVLFIWANRSGPTLAGKLLSLRPVVFIGLISYSLYLWHWTLLVYAKHIIIDIHLSWKLGILVASLIVSIISWQWVEKPFRKKGVLSKRKFAFGFAALSTVGLLVLSMLVLKMDGLPDRFDDDFDLLREDIVWWGQKYKSSTGKGVEVGLLDSETASSFAFWGDSHGLVLSKKVDDSSKKHGLKGYVYIDHSRIPVTGLITEKNPVHADFSVAVIQSIYNRGIKHVILVSRWSSYIDGQNEAEIVARKSKFRSGLMEVGDDVSDMTQTKTTMLLTKHLEMMARKLKSQGITVWLIKQVPESNNIHTAQDFYMGKKLPWCNHLPLQLTTSKGDHEKRQAHANEAIDNVPAGLIRVINPTSYFFRNSDRLKVYGERAYYSDDDHLTRAGADYYLTAMFDEIFAEIAAEKKGGG